MAFTFALLHGLGFAGGLSAAGLPAGHTPFALAFFSAGVEVGHFSFVTAAVLFMASTRAWLSRLPSWSWRVPALRDRRDGVLLAYRASGCVLTYLALPFLPITLLADTWRIC